MFQDALANESLVAQHCYGDPNHLRHILVKLREMIVPKNIGANTSDPSAIVQVAYAPGVDCTNSLLGRNNDIPGNKPGHDRLCWVSHTCAGKRFYI